MQRPPERPRGRTWMAVVGAALAVVVVLVGAGFALHAVGLINTSGNSTATGATASTPPLASATATAAPVLPSIFFGGVAHTYDAAAGHDVTTAETIYAVDPTSGAVRWSVPLGVDQVNGLRVVAAHGVVYAVHGQAIIALKASDGRELWQAAISGELLTPPVADNTALYISTSDTGSTTSVSAYRLSDGKLLWTHDMDGGGQYFSLALANGVLYTDYNDSLIALRAVDGSVLWGSPIGHDVEGSQLPYVMGDRVYIMKAGKVLAFNTADGSQRWQYTWPIPSITDGFVSGTGDLVIVGDNSGGVSTLLSAFHTADGSVAWSKTYSTNAAFAQSEPSAYSGIVYVSVAPGPLVALDANTGAQLWSASLTGAVADPPVLINGTLFETRGDFGIDAQSSYLYALNPTTGSVLWKFPHSHEFYTDVVAA